jgi:heat shock protein HtpX
VDRRWLRDEAHALILLCAMGALMGYCGWIASGETGVAWSILLGLAFLTLVRHVHPDDVLRAIKARPVHGSQAIAIEQRIAALSERAGLRAAPRLYHVTTDLPLAFSLGEGDAAAIVVTDRLLKNLNLGELTGVLAHELVHLRNGDIVLLQWGLVLGWATRVVSQVGCVLLLIGLAANALSLARFPVLSLVFLVFAPLLSTLLRLALSRDREAEADAEAAALTEDPEALASALIKIREGQQGQLKRLFPGARSFHLPTLLADHPPTEQRIRALRQLHRDQADP